jgi:heme exporter protein C
MKKLFPLFSVLTLVFLSYALYAALVLAPTERTMGDVQRIFYYHVPSAWTAFLLFFINFIASVQYLARRNSFSDRFATIASIVLGVGGGCIYAAWEWKKYGAEALSYAVTGIAVTVIYWIIRRSFSEDGTDALALVSAEVGVVFCTVVLVTGPIWARPVWGIWWTWDLRLTLTLVLWLIYVAYLVLRRFSSGTQTPLIAAVLAVFGALDVPLVYFSIWFFRTQHPSPVIGGGGSIDPRMLHVLLINWGAFMCFAALVCWSRYRLEKVKREVDETQALEALLEPRGVR